MPEPAEPATLVPPDSAAPDTTVPAADAGPASPAVPSALPGATTAEAPPVQSNLPVPPPLTPEEEALLRQGAGGGSDSSTAVPGTAPVATIIPEPAPADTPLADGDAKAPVVTLIKPDPALPSVAALPESPDGVTIDRLPRIGDAAKVSPETAAATAKDTPLAKYARSFDNPEGKPTFAVVLIDSGSKDIDRKALAALPFPVTFALDPTVANAADMAAIYRAAGQEVVMLATALPKGAAASDVEVALSALARELPETVAVMDGPEAGFQSDRPLATLVVPVIGGQGRGLLTWDRGLNAADQVARREAVPAAVVFRDLDGQGETPQVIRRYLDRAAFKAAQEGRVTVVGRASPETVAAILEWSVEGRAASVALAPLSAVLSTN